jgi:hypothetical protein
MGTCARLECKKSGEPGGVSCFQYSHLSPGADVLGLPLLFL